MGWVWQFCHVYLFPDGVHRGHLNILQHDSGIFHHWVGLSWIGSLHAAREAILLAKNG
jgi:hypothetical protein